MSDCPRDCGWRFDKFDAPRVRYAPGQKWFPLVWRGYLAIPHGSDAIGPDVKGMAIATHLIDCHPDHAEVQRVFAA